MTARRVYMVTLLWTGGNSTLSRFNWRKVWTGMKCNFSWEHCQKRYIIRKLSISRVRMWNFTRIEPKKLKVMAFNNSCTKAVLAASPGPTPKRCEPELFLAALGQVIRCSKALNLGSLNVQFQHDWQKDKKYSSFYFFAWELTRTNIARLSFMMRL